jgi:membrane associated rhomboid family serine protease
VFLPLHDRNPIRYVKFPFVTYSLIALNVVVFLWQLALPPSGLRNALYSFGAVPLVFMHGIDNQFQSLPDQITLVTYAFLHGDWLHLLSNMLFLWIFGDNIEDALGHVKFLMFYLACAVLSALAHAMFNATSGGPLIGASGAVAGVMGAYILLFPHARVYVLFRIVIPIPLPLPAMWMLGAWVGIQLFYAFTAPEAPIAWWAHLGGIAAGVLLCIPLRRRGVELLGGR